MNRYEPIRSSIINAGFNFNDPSKLKKTVPYVKKQLSMLDGANVEEMNGEELSSFFGVFQDLNAFTKLFDDSELHLLQEQLKHSLHLSLKGRVVELLNHWHASGVRLKMPEITEGALGQFREPFFKAAEIINEVNGSKFRGWDLMFAHSHLDILKILSSQNPKEYAKMSLQEEFEKLHWDGARMHQEGFDYHDGLDIICESLFSDSLIPFSSSGYYSSFFAQVLQLAEKDNSWNQENGEETLTVIQALSYFGHMAQLGFSYNGFNRNRSFNIALLKNPNPEIVETTCALWAQNGENIYNSLEEAHKAAQAL